MTEDVMKTEGHTPWPKLYFIPGDSESNAIIFPDDAWNGPNFSLTAVAPDGEEDRLCADVVAAMNERSALLKCEEALREARQFIMNGVELGYIHIPRNDPAADTLSKISAALTLLDEARHGK